MASSILVVGATGNTGRSVIRTLPGLLESKNASYRVLGLTRSLDGAAAKELANLPNVEMIEKDWTEIDAAWLKKMKVSKVYIAPHNLPQHFTEESAFHVALLQAGVKYVVRVSTNIKYMSPTSSIYYGRSHWAIENLLSQPEFKNLHWTSLQPNYFTRMYLASAANWIKEYKKSGNRETFKTNVAAEASVAMVDPEDVGTVGAHLLALDDFEPHDRAKYVVSGPENVNGKQIVAAIESYLGVEVQDVKYKDVGWIDDLEKAGYPQKVLSSIKTGCEPLWEGLCSLSGTPTSKEILQLAAPKRTIADALKTLVEKD